VTGLALAASAVDVAVLDGSQAPDPGGRVHPLLAATEAEELAQLVAPGRRREWLAARACLKWLLLRRGLITGPRDAAIRKDDAGRPTIALAGAATGSRAPEASLSHAGRFAGAALARHAGVRVGLDITMVSPRLRRIAAALARDHDPPGRALPEDVRLATLWALKEACAKARGQGLGAALGAIRCGPDARGGRRVLTDDGHEFQAWTVVHEHHVIAVAVSRRGRLRADDDDRRGAGRWRDC
jgi:phosphopantetheinyl transferase